MTLLPRALVLTLVELPGFLPHVCSIHPFHQDAEADFREVQPPHQNVLCFSANSVVRMRKDSSTSFERHGPRQGLFSFSFFLRAWTCAISQSGTWSFDGGSVKCRVPKNALHGS